KWFLENEKTVTQFCRKLAAERPLKDIRDEYNYPKKKGIKDECSRLLEASTMKSRRGFAIQRLMNAMRQAQDRKSGSAGMPRPISYAVFCLKKKKGITSYIQFFNVPNLDEAVPSYVSGAMAKVGNE